jgi:hypothetical protein
VNDVVGCNRGSIMKKSLKAGLAKQRAMVRKTQIEFAPTLLDIYHMVTFDLFPVAKKRYIKELKQLAAKIRAELDEESKKFHEEMMPPRRSAPRRVRQRKSS